MFLQKIIPVSFKHKIKENRRLQKLKGNKYYYPTCYFSSNDMQNLGENFPILYKKDVIACGKKKHCIINVVQQTKKD